MPGRGKRLVAALLACGAVAAPVGATAQADPPQRPSYRIIGGGPADFSQWPFAAAITHRGRFQCSASVISPDHVLTAAHCAVGFKTGKLAVITGRPDLRIGSAGQVHRVASKHISSPRRRHDLAVLRLATPTTAPAVTLATPDEDRAGTAPGSILQVAGWGATTIFHTRLPGFLKTTTLSARSKRRCFKAYGKAFKSVSMICAEGAKIKRGRYAPRTSPCGGDSGGPLVSITPAGPRQVGVTSFGPGLCGWAFVPVAFARVSDDLDFVAAALASP